MLGRFFGGIRDSISNGLDRIYDAAGRFTESIEHRVKDVLGIKYEEEEEEEEEQREEQREEQEIDFSYQDEDNEDYIWEFEPDYFRSNQEDDNIYHEFDYTIFFSDGTTRDGSIRAYGDKNPYEYIFAANGDIDSEDVVDTMIY